MGIRRGSAPTLEDYQAEDVEEALEKENEDEYADRASIVQSGWEAARKAVKTNASRGFVKDFRFSEDPQLVRFTDSVPIVYKLHWVNEKKGGRQTYVCMGDKCPLCRRAGHKPDQKFAFPIVNLSAEEPVAQLLVVSVTAFGMLDKLNEGRTGPLDRGFWAVSRSGQKAQTSYSFIPVKERDLAEDWDLDLDEVNALLDTIEPANKDHISPSTYEELNEIADFLLA